MTIQQLVESGDWEIERLRDFQAKCPIAQSPNRPIAHQIAKLLYRRS